jgi:hypothetical protein
VNYALVRGLRGLPGRSSLVRLLAENRHRPNNHALPPFTVEQILEWADTFRERTGEWPRQRSGLIPDTDGVTWTWVDLALLVGRRGLPGGSSLARLLAKHRGVRNPRALPPYTEAQILEWADAYFQRSREWPTKRSGSIPEAPGETWSRVAFALHDGCRGLPGGSSLARLLTNQRGARKRRARPAITEAQILEWADAYFRRAGRWPRAKSGAIPENPGATWYAVESALRKGLRGLPGGSSVALLLARAGRKQRWLTRVRAGE